MLPTESSHSPACTTANWLTPIILLAGAAFNYINKSSVHQPAASHCRNIVTLILTLLAQRMLNYSVTPGPFFWEFDTKSVNMKVKKVWWWGGGGLFDYSVTPGPFFWEFDTEFWVQSLDLDLDLGLDTGPDLELDNNNCFIWSELSVISAFHSVEPDF